MLATTVPDNDSERSGACQAVVVGSTRKSKVRTVKRESRLQVPLNDLSRSLERRGADLLAAAQRVINSGWYLLGPETEAFESEFAKYCSTAGCVGVGNGTDALELALLSVGCQPGDEVIVPANAGGYATTACVAAGATPVFCDIDPLTLLVDTSRISDVLSDRTKAVVATHLYGNVVDIDALRIALPADVAIVEDCAQAHGARLRGRPAGSLADVAAFSFYPTKNLGAFGDAGAVVANDPDIIERVRMLHQYGWSQRYHVVTPRGRNSRIDEMQAALLRVVLPDLEADNHRRSQIRSAYATRLGDRVRFPEQGPADSQPVVHLCVVRVSDRERILAELGAAGVAAAIHYPIADHLQPAWRDIAVQVSDLSETERACNEVLSLPCFPGMTDEEVDFVTAAVEQAL